MRHYEVLDIDHVGQVSVLWLDRPDRRNAMGEAFWVELPLAAAELSQRDGTRAVVVAARGEAFSVGLDLVYLASLREEGSGGDRPSRSERATRTYRQLKQLQGAITAVADCPKPVVAAIHGYCLGGGLDLAAACDVRLAAADAVFSVRETRMAMVADLGSLQRLPGVIARGHLMELALSGRDVDAERAGAMGLVSSVLPDRESLVRAAMSLAADMAANSPIAVQGTKAVLRAGEGRSVAEGLDYVAAWNAAFLDSHDLSEAVTAFIEKRPPEFHGR